MHIKGYRTWSKTHTVFVFAHNMVHARNLIQSKQRPNEFNPTLAIQCVYADYGIFPVGTIIRMKP
jgi:hypothetical protein